MITRCSAAIYLAVTIAFFAQASAVWAQSKSIAPGAVPNQIASARRIFIANGGENQPYGEARFSGGPERAFDEFYSAIKGLGRYELVGSPADADLVFEIEFAMPTSGPSIANSSLFGNVPYDSQFRLTIRDPRTNVMIWTMIEHVQWAVMQSNHDKNFDLALTRLVNDVEGLAARSVAVPISKP